MAQSNTIRPRDLQKAAAHCTASGIDIAQLALQFSIANEEMTTCITGSANQARIRQWAEWAEIPLDELLVAEVQDILVITIGSTLKATAIFCQNKNNGQPMVLKIDAHHHFWDLTRPEFDYDWLSAPGHEAICQTYLPATLAGHIEAVGVDKTFWFKHSTLLGTIGHWNSPLKPITSPASSGWVDLTAADIEDQLLRYKDQKKFVGIRPYSG